MHENFRQLLKIATTLIILSPISWSSSSAQDNWIHCANHYGHGSPNNCKFEGARQVRIGDGELWSYMVSDGGFLAYKCHEDNFPEKDFPHNNLICQYSSETHAQQQGGINWTYCANHYGHGTPSNCKFDGAGQVRIGDGETWSYIQSVGGFLGYKCNKRNFPEKEFSSNYLTCEYSTGRGDNQPESEPEIESWTHCANHYGQGTPNICQFDGLRQVRIGDGDTWSYKQWWNGFAGHQCNKNNFPQESFAHNDLICEYSSVIQTKAVTAPDNCNERHDCAGLNLAKFPAGMPGFSDSRINTYTGSNGPAATDDIGSFRTECELSHFAYADPLIYPYQSGTSHLHAFFGNTEVDSNSTASTIASMGKSTCDGGIENRSAYWVPALIDSSTKLPVIPKRPIWYYKEGYHGVAGTGINSLPEGLSMISHRSYWTCSGSYEKYDSIPLDCPKGHHLTMHVDFPQCWDTNNIYVGDQSHMEFANDGCPNSHPYAIPLITLNVRYPIYEDGQQANWRLSSDHMGVEAGSTAHADWINGWVPETSNRFIDNCLNASLDCHSNLLGDGNILY